MGYLKYYILFFLLSICITTFAQKERVKEIEKRLETLSQTVPALNDSVNISVNGASIQDFLRGIAVADQVNISIDPKLNYSVVNNFSNVRFRDVLVFLVNEYDLDIKIIGNILSISKYQEPLPEPVIRKPKDPKISFVNQLITLDLKNDSLSKVAKKVSQLTGSNVVVTSEIQDVLVSGYIQNSSVDAAIEKIAIANNISFEKTKDNFFILSEAEQIEVNSRNKSTRSSRSRSRSRNKSEESEEEYTLKLNVISEDSISIYADKAPLDSVVVKISDLLGKNYHILSELKEDVTLLFSDISYDNLLEFLFDGKDYSVRQVNGIYLIGEKKLSDLQETKIIQLQYRTVDAIKEIFPKNIQEDLEIIEFAELNSLLVSGISSKIEAFEHFIKEIDRLVPVILIEVMIVESKKSSGMSTGIAAGYGEAPSSTSTFLSNSQNAPGGIDFSFSASEINNLLSSLNGFAGFNIGKVSKSFYLNISALETNGILKVRSTPKLSTLNGHEAKLSSGETTYYIDETRSLISTQSINETYTKQYKPVNADLKITIKPIVSGDNQITLDIDVSQSDFTGSIDEKGPPGTINRSFKSIIRVKDQEMILLGGLEKNYSNDAGTGIPLLSRIPVIKWFFSSRSKEKSFNKLNIFIKPTVIN